MLAPSAYLASAASTLLLQQSILPDSIWMRSVGGVYEDIMDRPGQLTKLSQLSSAQFMRSEQALRALSTATVRAIGTA